LQTAKETACASSNAKMASIAAGLSNALPKPKYTGEDEQLRAQQRGPRIVGANEIDQTQIVLKVSQPQKPRNNIHQMSDPIF